ncbi:NAD(P)H-dependent oxidoreductase [Aliarcobacter butzleri]|uniref:NAD(P)H-dependent oxidoreductase n=1 Tax=Aliarcobacter butzleri TaxID=28197 RepID=UPI000DB8F3AF|nr:NAD(P)H-dependent oxidoreductase [Aliarcobacter butzleri]MCG3650787.1 NAD(P)H-dependent oxidoreductase [Aliarcobacter butzleri]MCG3657871.1 NAD(P)H-dependent oxidoreductase [Aliarcobacter butzleri]MCT7567511.1 NAD(P)H-dependent oxidoreductase [Aliarcobacter butzleri]MDN5067687.1 NAD(P)H-dependent oxidoreductase [Aliarcobacter butzleri]PZP11373.1 MAG: NAD(P)H-dependent oxidoreductase [Aliarcobacter butzleri]
MEKTFMEAMDFRHACKIFDETKKISDEDMRFILEAGRKSPSSFGQEGWKFLVITNEELRAKLKPFCWDQPQITTCSHLVIILAAIEAVKPESGIPALRFARREMPQEKKDFYNKLYKDHLTVTKVLDSDENVYSWTARQTYIAAGNMMTAAAIKGIDSCPIEGFNKAKVEEVLGLDTKKFQLSMVLPFGYRINPQSTQMRLPFEEVIEFIK